MGRKREQRLRRKARAQLRELRRRLDDAEAWRPVWLAAVAYVDEIYAPNIKEPFSIFNRRQDLVEVVRATRARRAARALREQRPARRAA